MTLKLLRRKDNLVRLQVPCLRCSSQPLLYLLPFLLKRNAFV